MSATGFLDACGFFPAAGGTADFVVSAAITGYQTPASAGAANGAVYSYRAQSSDLSQWEIGFGAYATGTTTLARTTVVASSTGSKVNFSAPPIVYITALSSDLQRLAFHPGYLYGLTLSTAGASATFGVAAGVAADATAVAMMQMVSAYTKTTSAWAVGSGNGALDTGTIANNTWYHVWLIQRSDTGVVDVLISTSATAPTLPTNYDRKRRIGSMRTNGSAQWTKFIQDGDYFGWDTPAADVNVSNPGTSAVLRTLTVPPGIRVRASMAASLDGNPGTAQSPNIYISDPSASDLTPHATSATSVAAYNAGAGASELLNGGQVQCFTNTSAQVRTRISGSTSGTVVFIITLGWADTRGRDG